MASDAWAICRETRRKRGLSQRALASLAGVPPATIARIEKGRMEPTLDLLRRIVRAAGCDLSVKVTDPDPDEMKSRAQARALSVEDRFRSSQSISALRASAKGSRRG